MHLLPLPADAHVLVDVGVVHTLLPRPEQVFVEPAPVPSQELVEPVPVKHLLLSGPEQVLLALEPVHLLLAPDVHWLLDCGMHAFGLLPMQLLLPLPLQLLRTDPEQVFGIVWQSPPVSVGPRLPSPWAASANAVNTLTAASRMPLRLEISWSILVQPESWFIGVPRGNRAFGRELASG